MNMLFAAFAIIIKYDLITQLLKRFAGSYKSGSEQLEMSSELPLFEVL